MARIFSIIFILFTIFLPTADHALCQFTPTCEVVEIQEIVPDFSWGYLRGVKQPLGSYFDGWSIHQTIKPDLPPQSGPYEFYHVPDDPLDPDGPTHTFGGTLLGMPDNILWAHEKPTGSLESGIRELPVAGISHWMARPSGIATFSPGGTIWYTYGMKNVEHIADCWIPPLDPTPMPFDKWDLYKGSLVENSSSFAIDEIPFLTDFVPYENNGIEYDDMSPSGGCLHATLDDNLLFFWRNGTSRAIDTTIRFRSYSANAPGYSSDYLDLGKGSVAPTATEQPNPSHYSSTTSPRDVDITIEQLWTKYDPRWDLTFATWQYFIKWKTDYPNMTPTINSFGSCPFVYSEDDGVSWKFADGTPANGEFPLTYPLLDYPHPDAPTYRDVIIPDDHLEGADCFTAYTLPPRHINMALNDLGVAPGDPVNGDDPIFWMVMPEGSTPTGLAIESGINFWSYDSGNPTATSWACTPLTTDDGFTGMTNSKGFACGVTKDYLVFVYAAKYGSDDQRNILKAKVGWVTDSGEILWSDPENIITLSEDDDTINWVSFVQPAAGYDDNFARFFFSYSDEPGSHPEQYRNKIGWVKVKVRGTLSAELNCTPSAGTLPFSPLMQFEVRNHYLSYRKSFIRLALTLATGTHYGNWRRGNTTLDTEEVFHYQFRPVFPDFPTLYGDNHFNLIVEDLTPPPYNVPPFWPEGDADTDLCTVTGIAPLP